MVKEKQYEIADDDMTVKQFEPTNDQTGGREEVFRDEETKDPPD